MASDGNGEYLDPQSKQIVGGSSWKSEKSISNKDTLEPDLQTYSMRMFVAYWISMKKK